MMKKTLAILLSLLLFLPAAVSAESPDGDSAEWLLEPEALEAFGAPAEPDGIGETGDAGGIAEDPSQALLECFDLIPDGDQLWSLSEEILICHDVNTGEVTASVPLADLLASSGVAPLTDGIPADLHLLSRESGPTLCVVTEYDLGYAVTALEPVLEGGGILLRGAADWTEAMAPFYGPDSPWLQIRMFALGRQVVVEALDASFFQHFWTLNPDTPDPAQEIGALPYFQYAALLPLESDLMLIQASEEEERRYEIFRMNPVSGENVPLGSFTLPAADGPLQFACHPAEGILCFTQGNTVYRFPYSQPEETAVPIAVFPEAPGYCPRGLFVGDQFLALSESGAVMACDRKDTLSARRLNVANIDASTEVADAAGLFNAVHPDTFVTVTDGGDEAEVLSALLSGSAEKDLYVISANTAAWDAIRDRGFAADLDGSALLKGLADQLPPAIADRVLLDGRLKAFPVAAEASCPILNVKPLCDLTGLTREQLPTDWTGLLQLMKQIADEGLIIEAGNMAIGESVYTADTFRQELFAWILRDSLQWLSQEGNPRDRLGEVLIPVLKAFEAVDFTRLGLAVADDASPAWDQIWLISMGQPEIAVLDMQPGEEFWPLSMEAGGSRVIPQSASILMINPSSRNREAALAFAETVWRTQSDLVKMTLNRSLNEPVVNLGYQSDLAYFESALDDYKAALAQAEDEETKAAIQDELAELQAFMQDYAANAQWSASEASIALYRSLEPLMRPALPEFWSADAEDVAVLQYLDGLISAETFVSELKDALNMAALEGQ